MSGWWWAYWASCAVVWQGSYAVNAYLEGRHGDLSPDDSPFRGIGQFAIAFYCAVWPLTLLITGIAAAWVRLGDVGWRPYDFIRRIGERRKERDRRHRGGESS